MSSELTVSRWGEYYETPVTVAQFPTRLYLLFQVAIEVTPILCFEEDFTSFAAPGPLNTVADYYTR